MICAICAPRVPGKEWVVLTTSGPNAVHDCSNGRATSKAVSWHSSRDAAWTARNAYRKALKGQARAFVARQPVYSGQKSRLFAP